MKRTIAIFAVLFLVGCPTVPLQAPKTFIEQVAYAESSAQAFLKTIDDLICTKGYDVNKNCLEPGKPLSPSKAIELVNKISEMRTGLKTSVRLYPNSVECFKEVRTPQECLQASQMLLLELETYLTNQRR